MANLAGYANYGIADALAGADQTVTVALGVACALSMVAVAVTARIANL